MRVVHFTEAEPRPTRLRGLTLALLTVGAVLTVAVALSMSACSGSDFERGSAAVSEPLAPAFSLSDEVYPEPIHPVTGVLAMGEEVVVSDRSTLYRIRFGTGELAASAGGAGEGPGELGRIDWIGRGEDDQVVVWDGSRRRFSFFSHELRFLRTPDPREFTVPRNARPQCVGPGGMVAMTLGEPGSIDEGLLLSEVIVAITETSSDSVQVLGRIADVARWRERFEEGTTRTSLVIVVPFAPRPIVRCAAETSVGGGAVFWGDGSQPTIFRQAAVGEPIEIALSGVESVPVSDEDRYWVAESPTDGPDVERMTEAAFMAYAPERHPYYLDFHIDGETGEIWALSPKRTETGAQIWSVHSGNGELLRRVSLPGSFTITEIREGLAVGFLVRADETHEVQGYRQGSSGRAHP